MRYVAFIRSSPYVKRRIKTRHATLIPSPKGRQHSVKLFGIKRNGMEQNETVGSLTG
jgi:hypothetical protein